MTTYTATAPNGLRIKRISDRNYTHASFVVFPAGGFRFVGFSSSADLALKAAKADNNWGVRTSKQEAKFYRNRDRAKYLATMEFIKEEQARVATHKIVVVEVEVAA